MLNLVYDARSTSSGVQARNYNLDGDDWRNAVWLSAAVLRRDIGLRALVFVPELFRDCAA